VDELIDDAEGEMSDPDQEAFCQGDAIYKITIEMIGTLEAGRPYFKKL
jgi:hypothetical protein